MDSSESSIDNIFLILISSPKSLTVQRSVAGRTRQDYSMYPLHIQPPKLRVYHPRVFPTFVWVIKTQPTMFTVHSSVQLSLVRFGFEFIKLNPEYSLSLGGYVPMWIVCMISGRWKHRRQWRSWLIDRKIITNRGLYCKHLSASHRITFLCMNMRPSSCGRPQRVSPLYIQSRRECNEM